MELKLFLVGGSITMSSGNNYNVFPSDNFFNRFINVRSKQRGLFDTADIFRDFDNICKEMNKMFNVLNEMSFNKSKDLIYKYETEEGDEKMDGTGPIVYGYSMTVGPDGKSNVKEFENVKAELNSENVIGWHLNKDPISSERSVFSDVNVTNKEVKVVLKMPGIKEEDIKIETYDRKVEIKTSNNAQRKYYKIVDLPKEADTQTTRFRYNNGILEVTFDKKNSIKSKGKDVFGHLRNIISTYAYNIISSIKSKIRYFEKDNIKLIYNKLLKLKNIYYPVKR